MIYTVIGVIIIILALILLAILFIPFHISFYLKKRDKDIRGNFQLKWLKVRIIKRTIPEEEEKEEKEEKDKEKEEKKKKTKFDVDTFLEILKQVKESIKYLTPILQAFLKSIKLEKFSLNLNIGFTSPVSTALISGYFWSASSILNLISSVNLSITPDFQNSKLDGTLELELRLTLFRVVAAFIKALTKKPVRDLIRSMRKLNK
ncbi:MAG: DUF2953 domain-containing protein [Methanothermobacter sp.]